jgi:hypothetical protein
MMSDRVGLKENEKLKRTQRRAKFEVTVKVVGFCSASSVLAVGQCEQSLYKLHVILNRHVYSNMALSMILISTVCRLRDAVT